MTALEKNALTSAQAIKKFQRKLCKRVVFTILGGIALSFVLPKTAIFAIFAMIVLLRNLYDKECQYHEAALNQFAVIKNWYHDPLTELRHVGWQHKRVRFYCAPSLLSINAIANRLISNDFAPRTPPPTGEVPRMRRKHNLRDKNCAPSPSNQMESARVETLSPTQQTYILPAGWTTSPVIYATPSDTPYDSAIEKNSTPASLSDPPENPAGNPSGQPTPRTSRGATSQSIADFTPSPEGGRKPRTNYVKVRSAKLRKAAIQIHGRNCIACGKNFDEDYGVELAKGYIEVHHLNNIASGVRTTDPTTDLVPLCSNCHKMADRLTPPPRTIIELRNRLFPTSRFHQNKPLPSAEETKSPVNIEIVKVRDKKPKKSS